MAMQCHMWLPPCPDGDSLNRRCQVVSNLGWGFFSKVGLFMDLSGPVSRLPSSQRIIQRLDEFKLAGVNGYKHFSEEIQTRQYRSLQVLLGSEYGPPADIWSVACMAFELLTGDSLFHPKAGEFMSLEEDHIGQIVELLARIPPDVAQSDRHSAQYFDQRGDLRHVGPLRPRRLYDVLVEKYNFLLEEASEFSNFLLRMLDYHSERRATAAHCRQHAWLTSS